MCVIMSEDNEKAILDALNGNPDYSENVWERVKKKKKMSRQTFFTTRDGLVNNKKRVKRYEGRKPRVILYLPEDEELMKEKFEIKEIKGLSEEYKDEYRKKHTEDIKSGVITPWIEDLQNWREMADLETPYLINFSKVNRVLFEDFKNHIKFIPNPFDELEMYETKGNEFIQAKKDLQHKVYHIIDEELDLADETFWFKEDSTSRKIKELLNFHVEDDDIKYNLFEWIYIILKDWYRSGFDEGVFDVYYQKFYLYFHENPVAYEYYIKITGKDEDIYCGSICKRKIGKKKLLNEIDERINNIWKRVKESEDIHDDITALYEMQRELASYVEPIIESLERHLELLILPNDCRYYPWKH